MMFGVLSLHPAAAVCASLQSDNFTILYSKYKYVDFINMTPQTRVSISIIYYHLHTTSIIIPRMLISHLRVSRGPPTLDCCRSTDSHRLHDSVISQIIVMVARKLLLHPPAIWTIEMLSCSIFLKTYVVMMLQTHFVLKMDVLTFSAVVY